MISPRLPGESLEALARDYLGVADPSIAVTVERGSAWAAIALTGPRGRVVLEVFPSESKRPRWLSGALLALTYRPLADGRSPFEDPETASMVRAVERAHRGRERPAGAFRDALQRFVETARGAGPAPAASRHDASQAPWRSLISHFGQGQCPAPAEAVVQAALELGFLDALRDSARSVADLASAHGCDEEGTGLLLRALESLEVLTRDAETETFQLAEEARSLLGEHRSVLLWRLEEAARWRELARWVRAGRAAIPDVMDGGHTGTWLRAIGAIEEEHVAKHVAALPIAGARSLLDVGSGPGRYAAEMLRLHPGLHVTLIDYPQSLPVAREHLAAKGVTERATFVEAPFFDDDWTPPSGHDVAWVAAVLHATGPGPCASLLRRLHASLAPGGRVIVSESASDAETVGQRMTELNYYLVAPRARGYDAQEITAMLREAGFAEVRELPSDPGSAVLEATKS